MAHKLPREYVQRDRLLLSGHLCDLLVLGTNFRVCADTQTLHTHTQTHTQHATHKPQRHEHGLQIQFHAHVVAAEPCFAIFACICSN